MDHNLILGLIVPQDILTSFEIVEIIENANTTELIFEEKPNLTPSILANKDVALDGFCNSVSILTFPLKVKPTYVTLKRRRWKEKGTDKHYSNDYDFTHPHIKATKEFAAFLKEIHGHTPDQYLDLCRTHGD